MLAVPTKAEIEGEAIAALGHPCHLSSPSRWEWPGSRDSPIDREAVSGSMHDGILPVVRIRFGEIEGKVNAA